MCVSINRPGQAVEFVRSTRGLKLEEAGSENRRGGRSIARKDFSRAAYPEQDSLQPLLPLQQSLNSLLHSLSFTKVPELLLFILPLGQFQTSK